MFKAQLEKDLDVFLNTDEFGSTALYNGVEISVNFRSKSDVIFSGTHEVHGEVPSCHCKVSDIQGIENGDLITIDGTIFYVLDLDKPSGGIQKIYLSEDRP